MGLGLRAVIKTEDGFDRADEFRGQGDTAFADTVGGSVEGLVNEGDTKGFLHCSDGAYEVNDAAFRTWCVRGYFEAVFFGEGADELDGGGVCTVALAVLCMRKAHLAGAVGGFERLFAPDQNRDSDFGAGWSGFFGSGPSQWCFFAAR